ncbi:MAG: GAF domain-containing protein [Planctomycetes bacterium]|nr:GAF domain-containing protein [Planctomycetota bacterium]
MKLIIVEDGARTALEFDKPEITLGRAIDNDIRLAGAHSSRHHCMIEQGKEAWVHDLGSANGVQVNGVRVEGKKALKEGDVLSIGSARLYIEKLGSGDPSRTQRIDPKRGEAAPETAPPVPAVLPDFGIGGFETHGTDERRDLERLRTFARVTKALLSETELSALLRLIVDSALALVGGERGFVLMAGKGGGTAEDVKDPREMKVRVARSFDRTDIAVPSTRISMGITHRVLESGRPLLSVDAGRDERFSAMASVEELRLRSVICFPIQLDGKTEGVLYLDNRMQRGAFRDDDLELVDLLAGQAAIAIKNARLVSELRERNQRLLQSSEQIQSLNEQLGRKVRDRDSELAVVRAELGRERGRYDYASIVGASDEMKRVFAELDRLISTELPVLIHGESGTGKELIARAIHYNGPRRDKPFVVENCAALPDALLESELFGHVRGAFTGADRAKKGLLEQASGGTLFLDEIGDMSTEMQKKLLRVLQEGEVRPLGSNHVVKVDVRMLAASHEDLEQMVKAGTFREDLYYRVNVLALHLPPLRARREDIPLLANALLTRAAREANRPAPHLSHDVLAALSSYDWPGNVRELENEMRRVILLAEDGVRIEHLTPAILTRAHVPVTPTLGPLVVGDLRSAVESFERTAIDEALRRAAGNKSRASKELGISRFALQRKLEKYGLAHAASGEPDLEVVPEEGDVEALEGRAEE